MFGLSVCSSVWETGGSYVESCLKTTLCLNEAHNQSNKNCKNSNIGRGWGEMRGRWVSFAGMERKESLSECFIFHASQRACGKGDICKCASVKKIPNPTLNSLSQYSVVPSLVLKCTRQLLTRLLMSCKSHSIQGFWGFQPRFPF